MILLRLTSSTAMATSRSSTVFARQATNLQSTSALMGKSTIIRTTSRQHSTTTPSSKGSSSSAKVDVVFEGNDDNFDELVLESKVPVIIDVMAQWCPPCKILGPILEKEVEGLKGKVTLVKIDSDESPQLARSLRVSSLPTVMGVFEGKQVDMFIGYPGPQKVKEFVAKIAQLNASGGKQ